MNDGINRLDTPLFGRYAYQITKTH
jgi:hypothetical protein